ncbi:uncharacterized protein BDV17DRAFT_270348 [Aspergillus undulatus]|uniref:uncharacterized protein n=1 Tax=Aspergillus undulatus TaxID=1810928 RepID=UPI003CCE5316
MRDHDIEGYTTLRFECCLMIDEECLRSILRAGEPFVGGGTDNYVFGYVNILDMEHDPTAEGYDEGPFYDGCMGSTWTRFGILHMPWPVRTSIFVTCIGILIVQTGCCILMDDVYEEIQESPKRGTDACRVSLVRLDVS